MKQKITIMKQRIDLSDEEISSYMDFDSLRKKQKEWSAQKQNRYTILKWFVPALLITSSAIWFFTFNHTNLEVSNPKKPIESKQNKSGQPTNESMLVKDSAKVTVVDSQDIIKRQVVKSSKHEIESSNEKTKPISNLPIESIYIQAEPIDGYASLYAYLNVHLKYPTESIKDSTQGVQTVSFIVNVNGKPEKIEFVESLGAPFERESKRLIESMPAWKPATLNGKPVPSKLVLPLTFQIQKVKAKD